MVTKQNIIEAAFRLFANKGFSETTTENIAESLGIKKQSLYSHFRCKHDIVLAVMQEHADEINNEIDGIIAEYHDKSIEMLLKFIFARLTIYLSMRDRLLLWKRILLFEIGGEFTEILNWHHKLSDDLEGILRSRYQHFNNPEKMISFFVSYMIVINGYLDWMLIAGYDNNTMESTWDNFWQGIKAMF